MSKSKSNPKNLKLPRVKTPRFVFFRSAAIVLAVLGLAGLAWALWPAAQVSQTYTLTPERLVELASSIDRPALPLAQSWQVQVGWPRWMRVGDPARITLTLEPLSAAAGPASAPAGAPATTLVVDGEAAVTGMDLTPVSGSIRTPLVAGHPLHLSWALAPQGPGLAHGSLWFYLGGQAANGEAVQLPVSEHSVDILVVSVLGLGATGMIYVSAGLLVLAIVAALAGLKVRSHAPI
jgi:hypothetical protein